VVVSKPEQKSRGVFEGGLFSIAEKMLEMAER
jgi:hypothetical protein